MHCKECYKHHIAKINFEGIILYTTLKHLMHHKEHYLVLIIKMLKDGLYQCTTIK